MKLEQKQEAFLDHIAKQLGRERRTEKVKRPTYRHAIVEETLQDNSQTELLEIAKEVCHTIHTDVVETTAENLFLDLTACMTHYGNGNVLIADDERFRQYGLEPFLENNVTDCEIKMWQIGAEQRHANIAAAADTNIGIAFGEFLLAESGTVVVESSAKQGRSFHFLPEKYIAIIPKSAIVPRSTQAAQHYDKLTAAGEKYGSSLNFISGPSNSGDIEMQLVVGVHGPIAVTYVIVTDR